jgi:hypothetical protein
MYICVLRGEYLLTPYVKAKVRHPVECGIFFMYTLYTLIYIFIFIIIYLLFIIILYIIIQHSTVTHKLTNQ